MSATQYQPEKGTESLVHVQPTKKNGKAVKDAPIEYYNPRVWQNVKKLAGYEADVVYEPKPDKAEAAPDAGQPEQLPKDKAGWYALYKAHQEAAQAEVLAEKDITIPEIRDLLGK